MSTAAPRYENSLQTAVRWGWNCILAYSAFRIIHDWIYPPHVDIEIPSLKNTLKENARQMRQIELCFRTFVEARKQYEEDWALHKPMLDDLIFRVGSEPSLDELRRLPHAAALVMNRQRIVAACHEMIEHISRLRLPTKKQQQRIKRILGIIKKYEDDFNAADLAEEQKQHEGRMNDLRDLYDHGVKHGLIDPNVVSFRSWQKTLWRMENPMSQTASFYVVSLVIVIIGAFVLYNLFN